MVFLIRAACAIPVSESGRSLINRPFFICNPFIIVSFFVKIINFVRYPGVEGYNVLCACRRALENRFFFDGGVVVWLAVVRFFWLFWLAPLPWLVGWLVHGDQALPCWPWWWCRGAVVPWCSSSCSCSCSEDRPIVTGQNSKGSA